MKGENKMKELVLMKIEAEMPQNLRLSIGSHGEFTKEEILDHVRKEDEIGRKIIQAHASFLKSVGSGKFTKEMVSA